MTEEDSTQTNDRLFPPNSVEEAEQQLEQLETEIQKMIWSSEDKEKKSLLYASLYQCNRIILEYKKKDLENEYQKELLKNVLRAEESEKERIAKTIHDDFGLSLSSLKMQLSFLQDQANLDEQQKQLLKDNLNLLEEMRQTIRAITEDLAPPTLKYLGYFKNVEALCLKLNCSNLHIKASFPADIRFDGEKEIHLFRITQELINNIIKHTKATKICLNYICESKVEEIRISYDDKGITSEDAERIGAEGKGSGLQNVISRAQLINASVKYSVLDESFSQISIML